MSFNEMVTRRPMLSFYNENLILLCLFFRVEKHSMLKTQVQTSQDTADTELETQVFPFPVEKQWTQTLKASQESNWTIKG